MMLSNGSSVLRHKKLLFFLLAFLIFFSLLVWTIRSDQHNRFSNIDVFKIFTNSKFFHNKLQKQYQISQRIDRRKNPGLILDTPGCKIAKMDPFDPSILHLYEEQKIPYDCKEKPIFMHSQPDGSISVDEDILQKHYKLTSKDIQCAFQDIHRKHEKENDVRENSYHMGKFRRLRFGVPLKEDYVRVQCVMGNTSLIQYIPLIRLKKSVESVKSEIHSTTPQLNVLLIGIDSISKLNFLRHFKRTHAFIRSKGTFLDMKGYTKLGENTFPNLIPLLTGQWVENIWNETLKDTKYFDDVDIIWKHYSERGYRTLFAEDSPFFGTFNYGKRGFNNTPTDYYLRPLYLAMHNSEVRNKGYWYCFNSQLEPEIIYDYTKDFTKAMEHRPYFAFAMTSALTHDYLNHAGYDDFPTVKLLEDLWNIGVDKNTVIFLFGDHGLRYGEIRKTYVGKFEERMPFMYVHFPTWFMDKYPEIARHLRHNQERLVTFYDVHATLIHLLNPTRDVTQEESEKFSPNGLSFMGKISPYRTCEKANIYEHWCVCQVFTKEFPFDPIVLKSAKSAVDQINVNIQNTSCHALELKDVLTAELGQLNDMVLRFESHGGEVTGRNVEYWQRIVKYEDYVVIFSTEPEGVIFEATVRRNVENDTLKTVHVIAQDEDWDCYDVMK